MEELRARLKDLTAQLDVDLVCTPGHLECLRDLARGADSFHGEKPPAAGYTLAEAVSTIANRGTREDIGAALALLKGWSFKPKPGRRAL